MRATNPILRSITLPAVRAEHSAGTTMTLNGTIYRAAALLCCVIAGALIVWTRFGGVGLQRVMTHRVAFLVGGLACGVCTFALAWLTERKKKWSSITSPAYALVEGLLLGILTLGLEAHHHGTAVQAVTLTFALCFILLVAYRIGIIRVTDRFRRATLFATCTIALFYLGKILLVVAGAPISSFFEGGILGILASVVAVSVAAMNLVADFDFVDQCTKSALPKYMEWYAAFGLIVTLIWLYLEIVRLLTKAQNARETGNA